MSRELLKRAYEMMHCPPCTSNSGRDRDFLCDEIKAYLAKPLPEPVGYVKQHENGWIQFKTTLAGEGWTAVYAEPPAAPEQKRINQGELIEEWQKLYKARKDMDENSLIAFIVGARFAEERHDIKEQK